ncbi:hypothetical protein D3C81_1091790 [compost metagenome]
MNIHNVYLHETKLLPRHRAQRTLAKPNGARLNPPRSKTATFTRKKLCRSDFAFKLNGNLRNGSAHPDPAGSLGLRFHSDGFVDLSCLVA